MLRFSDSSDCLDAHKYCLITLLISCQNIYQCLVYSWVKHINQKNDMDGLNRQKLKLEKITSDSVQWIQYQTSIQVPGYTKPMACYVKDLGSRQQTFGLGWSVDIL